MSQAVRWTPQQYREMCERTGRSQLPELEKPIRKRARREDLGITFRSIWEHNISLWLDWRKQIREINSWQYEPVRYWFCAPWGEVRSKKYCELFPVFIGTKLRGLITGVRNYVPDFVVYAKGSAYVIEVKGWMDDTSKIKLKRMALYYPQVRIEVIGSSEYRDIKAQARGLAGWL